VHREASDTSLENAIVRSRQKDDRRDLVVPTQILLTLRQPIFTRWNDD